MIRHLGCGVPAARELQKIIVQMYQGFSDERIRTYSGAARHLSQLMNPNIGQGFNNSPVVSVLEVILYILVW